MSQSARVLMMSMVCVRGLSAGLSGRLSGGQRQSGGVSCWRRWHHYHGEKLKVGLRCDVATADDMVSRCTRDLDTRTQGPIV